MEEDFSSTALVRANAALAALKSLDDYFVRPSMARFPGDPNDQFFEPLKGLLKKLRPELTTLLLFFKCVRKWTFLSEEMEPLDSLALRIASYFTKVSEQIVQLEKGAASARSRSRFRLRRFRLLWIRLLWIRLRWFRDEKKELKNMLDVSCGQASKWSDLISDAAESIEVLVSELREFFVEFGCSFAFQVRSPRDVAYEFPWMDSYLDSIDCTSFPNLALQISSLKWKLHELVSGFRKLQSSSAYSGFENDPLFGYENGKLQRTEHFSEFEPLLNRCREVALGAGVVFCEYWYTGKTLDLDKVRLMCDAFSRLQSKIDLWDSKFFDMCVRLLRKGKTKYLSPKGLLDILLGTSCPVLFQKNRALYDDLRSLISVFIWITPEEGEYMDGLKSLSVSVRKVIMEAGSLQEHMLQEHEIDLLEEIWFLKMDIFLQGQLNYITRQHYVPLDTLKEWMKLVRPKEERDDLKLIATLEHEVFSVLDDLVDSSSKEEVHEDFARIGLQALLLKIVLFWAESFLVKFLNKDENLMERTAVRHQIKSLLQGLRFLAMSISYFLDSEDDSSGDEMQEAQAASIIAQCELVFTRIESVARRVVSLRSSTITAIINEENQLMVHEFLDEINFIRIQLKDIFVVQPMSKFPQTDGPRFIDSLVTKLKQGLPAGLPEYEEHLIQEILSSLNDLTPLLYDMQQHTIEDQAYQELFTQLKDAAYETEYLVDSLVLGIVAKLSNKIRLYHIMEDTKIFHLQLRKLYESKNYEVKALVAAKSSALTIFQGTTPTIEEPAVCLNDQEEEIINRLIWGPFKQEIVSIVGMPGIGKTTLARRVYNNVKVIYHFHIRAWCNVSQRYNKIYDKKRLLLEILYHILGMDEKLAQMPLDDLEFKLRQKLLKKRYFIVLDDVWDIEAWNDLERSFPDDGIGSRILMTSRIDDLASKANPTSYCHPARLMSSDESWNLLSMKVFNGESCSEELMVVGKQIAFNCKGLPLAVVAIAGLLERIEKTQASWSKIATSLSSMIIDDPETRCRDILELSYKHLPDHLKACFLYFGAFLEHKDIPVSKLIYLWIAEGFIQEVGSNPLEDLGEAYLMDLIRRSLVIPSGKRSDGVVKACHIHDLLRDMCLTKSKEENFFQSVTRYAEADISFAGLDYGEDSDNNYPSESVTYEAHRLCIFSKRKDFAISRSSGPRARSLLFFADSDMNPSCPYNLSFVSYNFKLLKVLDMECINVGSSFFNGIVSLMHLRYLAVSGNINSVPSSIKDLKNLETFLLKGLIGKVVLPPTIWSLTNLRHLHVKSHAVFSFEGENLESLVGLDNLVSLSSPLVSYGDDLQKMTSRLPNLQKMRCILLELQGQLKGHNSSQLDFPAKLQSLTITYFGKAVDNIDFIFPVNLKKLTLSNFRLPWNRISVIGRLQNLEVLKLLSRAFEGENWEMVDGEFSKLKFLKLESLDIAQWYASSDHLPNLQQLVLQRCEILREVPPSFADIPTLKVIQLYSCSHSCEESARSIAEDVEGLEVVINSDKVSTS